MSASKQIDVSKIDAAELDWIQINKELNENRDESSREKMSRKIKENPLVPIGCLATALALSYGLWTFRKGKTRMSQYMMRTRIAAQGFTVVALMFGVAMSFNKNITSTAAATTSIKENDINKKI